MEEEVGRRQLWGGIVAEREREACPAWMLWFLQACGWHGGYRLVEACPPPGKLGGGRDGEAGREGRPARRAQSVRVVGSIRQSERLHEAGTGLGGRGECTDGLR